MHGPLAHFFLARDGVVHVVAAGKCNHAGVVLEDAYANENAIGIEAEATGVPGAAGDWPPGQMAAYARLCRALQLHFKLGVGAVRGHKEVASPKGRKTDPDFDMSAFRGRVAAIDLTPSKPAKPKPKPKPEVNVALTNADVDLIWNHPNTIVKQSPGGALKTTLDRVDSDNLQLQVKNGIAVALADSQSQLSVRFTTLETKLDAILAALNPPIV